MLVSFISLLVAFVIIVFDQVSKFLVFGTPARSIIGNFMWFESTLNTGAAFSILEGQSWILITISSIASVFLLWAMFSKKHFRSKTEKILFGVIFSGTISNLFDRIFYRGVRDFISLRFIHFAIFNIADIAIVVGIIILVIFLIAQSIRKEKK